MTRPAGYLLARGTAERLPLASGSVDLCLTSPPFFGLRQYQGVEPTDWPAVRFAPMPGLEPVTVPAMTCTLGNEPDPSAFTAHLVHVFRDVWRVLSSEGLVVCNMGDSYAGSWGNQGRKEGRGTQRPINGPMIQAISDGRYPATGSNTGTIPRGSGLKPGALLGIPWRLAFALQADSWLLRSAPPWIKPDNAMPESVQSRPGTAHEMIFVLAKSDRYYWDADATRRASVHADRARDTPGTRGTQSASAVNGKRDSSGGVGYHPNGRLWRTADVFCDALDECIAYHRGRAAELEAARDRGGMIVGGDGEAAAVLANPQSFKGSHFATWGGRLISPFIRAATSEAGICSACSRGWRRVVERDSIRPVDYEGKNLGQSPQHSARRMLANVRARRMAGEPHDDPFPAPVTLGWSPACSCSAPPRPAVVLDPFGGSMSTVVAALALGRDAIGIDMSMEYIEIGRKRLERPHAAISAPAAKSPAPLPLFPEADV